MEKRIFRSWFICLVQYGMIKKHWNSNDNIYITNVKDYVLCNMERIDDNI